MDLAEKEHKKRLKKEPTKKMNKVMPTWFNEKIESKEENSESDEEFKSFIEEFRK